MAWAPDYCTVPELKEYLRITDSVDDAVIAWAITAASRAIDQAANRQFGLLGSVEARYYIPVFNWHRNRWVVYVDDFMTVTGLVIGVDLADDATYSSAISTYTTTPVNAVANGRPWTCIEFPSSSSILPTRSDREQVKVTAKYGWTTIPSPITQATLLQGSRLVQRREAPFGIAGSPDTGSEMRLLAKVDPDVEVTLRPFRRVWGAV